MTVASFRLPTSLSVVRALSVASFFVTAPGLAGAVLAQDSHSDPLVATVNGTQIHESDLAVVSQLAGRNIPTKDPVERREAIMKMVVDAMLLGQAATERKIVDEADLQRRTTYARNQGLAEHLVSTVMQQAVTEDALHKAYDDLVVKNPEPELHLRQMLFLVKDTKPETAAKAEEKAQLALKRLGKGEDFAAVFADMSDDASNGNGGDLGWRIRAELGKEISDAALSLKNGESSPVIRTLAGFHIVKLEDRRERKPPSFEQARATLVRVVATRAQSELIDQVRAAAKIERFDQTSGTNKAPGSN